MKIYLILTRDNNISPFWQIDEWLTDEFMARRRFEYLSMLDSGAVRMVAIDMALIQETK